MNFRRNKFIYDNYQCEKRIKLIIKNYIVLLIIAVNLDYFKFYFKLYHQFSSQIIIFSHFLLLDTSEIIQSSITSIKIN